MQLIYNEPPTSATVRGSIFYILTKWVIIIKNNIDLINLYADELLKSGKSACTVKNYTIWTNQFLNWIEEITGETFKPPILQLDIKEYKSYLINIKKGSLSTVNANLSALQSFSDFLCSEFGMTPIKVQRIKGAAHTNIEVLEKNELYKLRRYVKSKDNKLHTAIIELILYTGIRENEICSLALEDVILTERKGKIIIKNGKGCKYREINLHNDCRSALLEYLEVRPNTTNNKFFISNSGALTPSAIYKLVRRAGSQSINKNIYPHLLRHQCFTQIASKVTNAQELKALAEVAGHNNIKTTFDYYIASTPKIKETLINSIDFTN